MLCPTMPLRDGQRHTVLVLGLHAPGVSPLAVRDRTVYFFSPCARGTFSVPLASLFDARPAYARAADIRLVGSTPADYVAEELLDFGFNPSDPNDPFLYGCRSDATADHPAKRAYRRSADHCQRLELFDFPSSLAFLPAEHTTLLVVSNQQERTTLTNDAISEDAFDLPFLVTKVVLRD